MSDAGRRGGQILQSSFFLKGGSPYALFQNLLRYHWNYKPETSQTQNVILSQKLAVDFFDMWELNLHADFSPFHCCTLFTSSISRDHASKITICCNNSQRYGGYNDTK